MSLIPAERDKLTVGKPLPWTLYDKEHRVLLGEGEIIESDAQLYLLLASRPLRDARATPREKTLDGSSAPQYGAAEPKPENASEARFGFHDMRLRVGDRIQLQPPASMGSERHIVRLLGYLDQSSLMVTAPTVNGLRIPLQEHDKIVARVFASQKAFAFDCTVLRVCKIPYDYLHLSFPSEIQGAMVRKSPRIKTRIIAAVTKEGSGGAEPADKTSAVIVNLSADGALLAARRHLAEKLQELTLAFRVNLHNMEAYVTTRAVVRNLNIEEEKGDSDNLIFQHGVQFLDLQPTDRMILQSLIYQQMIEEPQSLA